MPESQPERWAVYAPRPEGSDTWVLRGIYPSQRDADRHGRQLRPRMVVPISMRGRPPERFASRAALERWFGAQGAQED